MSTAETFPGFTIYNLREGIGMVLQNNTLFSGTIEENLRWGDEDASEEEIKAAAHSAQQINSSIR